MSPEEGVMCSIAGTRGDFTGGLCEPSPAGWIQAHPGESSPRMLFTQQGMIIGELACGGRRGRKTGRVMLEGKRASTRGREEGRTVWLGDLSAPLTLPALQTLHLWAEDNGHHLSGFFFFGLKKKLIT